MKEKNSKLGQVVKQSPDSEISNKQVKNLVIESRHMRTEQDKVELSESTREDIRHISLSLG